MKRNLIRDLAMDVLDSDLDFVVEDESEEAFIYSVMAALMIQAIRELKK